MKQQKNTSFTLTMNSHTGKTSSEELINRTKKNDRKRDIII